MTVNWKSDDFYIALAAAVAIVIASSTCIHRCSPDPNEEAAQALQADSKAAADAVKDSALVLNSMVLDVVKEQRRLNEELAHIQKRLDTEVSTLRSQLDTSLGSIQGLMDATLDTQLEILRRGYENYTTHPELIGPAFDDLFGTGPGYCTTGCVGMDSGEGVLVREVGEAGTGDVPGPGVRAEGIPD